MIRLSVACVLLSIAACASNAPLPGRPNPVGLTMASYVDDTRQNWDETGPRPLATAVWYPAEPQTPQSAWDVGIFHAGTNAIDAPIASSTAKWPLVVISHGTGGGAATIAWLAESLAANGYIVAAVNHHGNTGYEPALKLQGFVVWWDRPQDLKLVVDRLLADPRFEDRIDVNRIGVAGYSLGGYTAIAAVGGQLDYQQWQTFCAGNPQSSNCHLPPESSFTDAQLQTMLATDARVQAAITHMGDSFVDARFKAAFTIAPVLGPVFTLSSLESVSVPLRITVGTADDQGVPSLNAEPMAAHVPGAALKELPAVTHYSFLPPCTFLGGIAKPEFCTDPPGLDRAAIHEQVAAEAVEFFNAILAP